MAVTSLVSGVMRASRRSGLGAIAQQGNRLLAGVVFVGASQFLSGLGAAVTFSICALVVAIGCVVWSSRLEVVWLVDDPAHHMMRRLGVGYSLSMLTLAAGDWVDLVLAGEFGNVLSNVGQYGQLKLLALYQLLSVGSILGFLALPAWQLQVRRSRRRAWRWAICAAAGSVAATAALVPVAWFAASVLFHVRVSWALLTVLGLIGGLRLFYVLPSAFLGAVAPPRWLFGFGVIGAIGLAVQVVVTVLLAGGGVLPAVAYGLLAATAVRVTVSVLMCARLLRAGGAPA